MQRVNPIVGGQGRPNGGAYIASACFLLACLLVIVHVVNIVYIYSIPAQTSPSSAELAIT